MSGNNQTQDWNQQSRNKEYTAKESTQVRALWKKLTR